MNSSFNWFQNVFGFTESVKSVKDNISCTKSGDNWTITSKANNATYNAGNFQIRSASSFKIGNNPGELPPRGNGTLNIIHGHGRSSKKFEIVDILLMESFEPFNGATFLAASNFNALEFVSQYQTASDGISGYHNDMTQGPYAALAAPPAILFRNYFVPHDGFYGQVAKPINLLERTPIEVQNGYPLINSTEELESLQFDWENPDNWPVAVHRNCQVVLTRDVRGFKIVPESSNKIVHQVYAAAFNFYGTVIQNEFTMKLSEHLLTNEYKATILAAWENSVLYPGRPGSNKLFLTLLGGGVFGNPHRMILNSILNNLELIKQSGLEVYICCYSDNSFRSCGIVLDAVRETGGKVVDSDDPNAFAE